MATEADIAQERRTNWVADWAAHCVAIHNGVKPFIKLPQLLEKSQLKTVGSFQSD